MIIYRTTNNFDDSFYIGQTAKDDYSYLGSGLHLKRAIKKHGAENFKRETLEVCSSKKNMDDREIYWINKTNAIAEGYNIASGGQGGNLGHIVAKKKSVSMKKFMKENPDFLQGKHNPNHNTTIYEFYNYKTKESFIGTKYDLGKKLNTRVSAINGITSGARCYHKNWILSENIEIYTEQYFKELKIKNSKLARSCVINTRGGHKGKHWYHNPLTNKSVLSYDCPNEYKKGRI